MVFDRHARPWPEQASALIYASYRRCVICFRREIGKASAWLYFVIRLANPTLISALRFVQRIGGAATLGELKAIVPEGFGSLISSDRVSMDEVDRSPKSVKVIPSPVPAWWRRLGEVHQKFVHEHPLWDVRKIKCNQVIAFSDYAGDARWNSSTLYREYYLSLGIRCQLGVQINRAGSEIMCVSFSRACREFLPQDRALIALLSPHVGNAYRTLVALTQAKSGQCLFSAAPRHCKEIIAIKADGKTISDHSPGAMELLEEFFACDTGMESPLPDEICRWLVNRNQLLLRGELSIVPFAPLVVCRGLDRLTLRVVTMSSEAITLLLECKRDGGDGVILSDSVLTKRECEVLQWAGEGKRNTEIGIILGVSSRTVEKHFENIFRKLAVETRTAAIRMFLEQNQAKYIRS